MRIANQISLLRIAFLPLCIIFLLYGNDLWAAITFILLLITDALDGYFARKQSQPSAVGQWLDPLCDKVLMISILIILIGVKRVHPIPVVIIFSRDLIVATIRTENLFAASLISKAKTFVQGIATLMLIINFPFGEWVLWFSILLSLLSGLSYLRRSRILYRL
jgi:CDP-diacylglycerol--glycerol-3-phosphate 3-phosphatidyltransferase